MKRGEKRNMIPRKTFNFRLSKGERDLIGGFERIMKYGDLQACIDFIAAKIDTVDAVFSHGTPARI